MTGSPSTHTRKPHSNGSAEDVSWPTCSVIVPVYNHWELVPELLECLQGQTLPQEEFEVILMDNGSTNYAPPESLPSNVRILHCETPGSYAARNAGVAQAASNWVVFTDADCRPSSYWLAAMLNRSRQDPQGSLLAGGVEMYTDSARPNAYEIYDLVRGIPQEHYVRRGYAATANLLVPKSMVNELGGFNATRYSGGDVDLCNRARARGYALQYAPDAVVYHPARRSWEDLATKARRIKGGQLGCGALRTRLYWAIRTVLPPLPLYYRFATSTGNPVRFRFVAVVIQTRLWGLELVEMGRLFLTAGVRERR
ncbi:glycosyltransferase family 2 protein [Thioalkalivibrio versutus]|uniref:glycosyltransferase family 2 protein n=1 Tax=Thioalkalivibrio versutus TaxID=106634 RepID=UPI0009E3F5B3|nr:glycosyltransferase [Thioalkalivibrio versutus]